MYGFPSPFEGMQPQEDVLTQPYFTQSSSYWPMSFFSAPQTGAPPEWQGGTPNALEEIARVQVMRDSSPPKRSTKTDPRMGRNSAEEGRIGKAGERGRKMRKVKGPVKANTAQRITSERERMMQALGRME
jgi:hypothetical protein